MRDTTKIDWRVPTAAWEAFREHVREECGGIDGYLGYEAERAMREFADEDGGNRVEDLVDRLVHAAGRNPDGLLKQKTRAKAGDETTRVTARVDASVKEEFKKTVDEGDTDDTYGQALARAVDAYRDGGRFGRLQRKLERIVDDAASILTELTERDTEDRLPVRERRTIAICENLSEQFTDDELRAEIASVAGDSQPTIREYRERVVDRLGVEPHPNNAELWVPEHVAETHAPDGTPRECRRPVEMLDRQERIRRIKLDLGRRAASRDTGCLTETVANIQSDVFDGEVSKSSVLDLVDAATSENGFACDRSGGGTKLKVNLNQTRDSAPDLLAEIFAYRDGEPAPSDTTTTDSLASDTSTEGVDDEWQRIEMATDGGWNE